MGGQKRFGASGQCRPADKPTRSQRLITALEKKWEAEDYEPTRSQRLIAALEKKWEAEDYERAIKKSLESKQQRMDQQNAEQRMVKLGAAESLKSVHCTRYRVLYSHSLNGGICAVWGAEHCECDRCVLRGLCPPDQDQDRLLSVLDAWSARQTKTNDIEHGVDHEKTVNLKQA